MGVNVPNFGPGTEPGVLRRWAANGGRPRLRPADDLRPHRGAPRRRRAVPGVVLRTVHHPRLASGHHRKDPARDDRLDRPVPAPAADRPDGRQPQRPQRGRLVLGVGAGWAVQEFDALGVPFGQRGKLTDDYLRAVRAAWADEQDYRGGRIPIWVGGNSDAGLRRAVRLGEAWHPLRFTMPWLR